ncbi:MAG: heme ABC exporter ATP-binding protein CcmA [Alphaproteobacteria bacterium]
MQKLEVKNLGCMRGGRPVYRGLNFSATSGQIIALRGPNGSGKTTILRALAGLLEPVKGQVFCDDIKRPKFPFLQPHEFAWIAHGNGIKRELSAYDNLQFLSALMPNGNSAKIAEAIELLGLSDVAHKEARFYSAGQMRRLALCRLVMCPAPLWLMDEPLNALDKNGRQMLNDMIQNHISAGGFVIMADHEGFLEEQSVNLNMADFAISAKEGWKI